MKINFLGKCVWGTAMMILCLAGGLSLPNACAQDQSVPNSGDAALPSNIPPNSPLAQVVHLAQSGVEENVILAYINSSSTLFNLTSDQIIYLKDLGLPSDAVTAMIQRDQQLGATATAAPAATPETTAPTETPEQPAEVTQNYFYDSLSPYGGWVNVEGYGLCWQPTVVVYNSDWQPYCDHGHWVYTDAGWYWLSDYSWGATAFHYGRWFHDAHRGWCWWPDTMWAPSWVTWRYADDYCGWAPLPPRTVYREGAGFFYNGAAVSAGFDFGLSVNFFTFVPTRNFCDPHPRTHRVARADVAKIYNHTTIINNFNVDSRSHTFINNGIPPQRIAAVTRTEIHPVSIRETSAPVTRGEQIQKDTLVVNRPHFDAKAAATLNNGIRPRPVATVPSNQPRPLIINGNGNNFNSRSETPAQNNFSQPSHNASPTTVQKPPATYNSPPAQTQNSGYDPDKRIYSPKQQQSEQQSPRVVTSNPKEPETFSAPEQRQVVPQESTHSSPPVERPQNDAPRQNYPESAPKNAVPSAPASNSQSGSQKSDKDQGR